MFKNKKKIGKFILASLGVLLIGSAILSRLSLQSQQKSSMPAPEETPGPQVSVSVPEGLPESFPVYPSSEFVSVSVSENGKGRSFIWKVEESPNLVYEYYKSDFRIKGWTITNTQEIGTSFALSFDKEDFKGFLAVFLDNSNKTIVSATIGSRKP
jgi:hypothetical protein